MCRTGAHRSCNLGSQINRLQSMLLSLSLLTLGSQAHDLRWCILLLLLNCTKTYRTVLVLSPNILLHLQVVGCDSPWLLVLGSPVPIWPAFGLFKRCLKIINIVAFMRRLWVALSMYIVTSLLRGVLVMTVLIVALNSFGVRKGTTSVTTQITCTAETRILLTW